MPAKPTAVESLEPAKRRGRPAGSKNAPKVFPSPVLGAVRNDIPSTTVLEDNKETDISSYLGYIKGLRNNIFIVTGENTGKVTGDMITDDPVMLAHFKGVSQWAIHREFLHKDDMLKSIGKLGVVIVGGVKYNKVVFFNGVRLENEATPN